MDRKYILRGMGNEKINRFSDGFYRLSAYFCGGIIYDRYFCEVNMLTILIIIYLLAFSLFTIASEGDL
jgi:hypothetical protein